MVYSPGKKNVVADCLSRAFDTSVVPFSLSRDDEEDVEDLAIQTIFGNLATSVLTLDS